MAAEHLQMSQVDLASRHSALTSDLWRNRDASKHAQVTLVSRMGHSLKLDLLVAIRSPFLKTYLRNHFQGPGALHALPPEPTIFVPCLNHEILEQAKEFLYTGALCQFIQ